MESLDVFTQKELDEALARPDVIPICSGDGAFEAGGDSFLRAADSARVSLRDAAEVEAGGRTTVVASGTAYVTARDWATVELSDSARAEAYGRVSVVAWDRSRVTAGGQSVVEATGEAAVTTQALAIATASERCAVRALSNSRVHVSGEAHAWAWGTSVVRAQESAVVSAWGSANVLATGASAVEARENAIVVAGGNARVRAFGAAMVRARGKAQVEAGGTVTVVQHGAGVTVSGEPVRSASRFATGAEWCEYYGVEVKDGVATLYKAVEDDFTSYHGMSYRPGTEPVATDWDAGEEECGGGLHFSPLPTFALPHPDDALRFVACPVRLEDIVVHPDGTYPDKVKARAVCAPVYEVREDGSRV